MNFLGWLGIIATSVSLHFCALIIIAILQYIFVSSKKDRWQFIANKGFLFIQYTIYTLVTFLFFWISYIVYTKAFIKNYDIYHFILVNIVIYICLIAALTSNYSWFMCIIGLLLVFLFYWLYPNIRNDDMISRLLISYALTTTILGLLSYFIKKKRNYIAYIGIIIIVGIDIIVALFFDRNNILFNLMISILEWVSFAIFFSFIKGYEAISLKIQKMAKTTIYTDDYFISPVALKYYFYNFIKKNNVENCIVAYFNFFCFDESELNKRYIDKQKFSMLLFKKFYSCFKGTTSFFFKSSKNEMGFVISCQDLKYIDLDKSINNNNLVNRPLEDKMFFLQDIINRFPKNFNIDGIKFDSKLQIFASIYGIHSNNLYDLLKINHFLKNNVGYQINKNCINLFNSKNKIVKFDQKEAYKFLSNKVNLQDFNVDFDIRQLNNANQDVLVCPLYNSLKYLTNDFSVFDKIFGTKIANLLTRHLATVTIKKYVESNYNNAIILLLPYPIDELNNENFALNFLLKKIEKLGMRKQDFILLFDMKNILVRYDTLLNNLLLLQNNDVSYFLINFKSVSMLDTIKPYGLVFDNIIAENPNLYKKLINICKKYNINVLK